ncbi:MAG: alcohol dehydrogenase catalytic domain-containing protein [Actinomycetota bacterium]
MRAAVMHDIGKLAIEEVPKPTPQRGEVLVKIKAVGVCHTDLSVYEGKLPAPTPVILGHEGAGIVEEVGEGVTNIRVGDHVVCSIIVSCGACQNCRANRIHQCEVGNQVVFGGTMLDGTSRLESEDGEQLAHFFCQSSFAEYAVVPERAVAVVSKEAPFDRICLLGCGAATGIGAVTRRAQVPAGASVVIVGAGGVGISAVLGARLAGAHPIIVADINPRKLDYATRAGATHVVDVGQQDLTAAVLGITGTGADFAFDAVGADGTLASAFEAARPGATVVAIGLMEMTGLVTIDIFSLLFQKVLTGTNGGSVIPGEDLPAFVDLYLDGRLDLDLLASKTYRLDEIELAFEDMKAGNCIRGVITF